MLKSFSLIIPTLNRYDSIPLLLQSIVDCNFDKQKIEVIIIDQNQNDGLASVIKPFESRLSINHKRVTFVGLSKAKNYGISLAKNDLVWCLDDDLILYNNSLECAAQFFEDMPEADILVGRVYDRINNANVMRSWKNETLRLKKSNYLLNSNAVCIITKNKKIRYDEEFGVGGIYGNHEDSDYFYRAIDQNLVVYYTDKVDVYHGPLNTDVMTPDKAWKYGFGFGAFIRKSIHFYTILHFFKSLVYHLSLFSLYSLTLKFNLAKLRLIAITSRIVGFAKYKR